MSKWPIIKTRKLDETAPVLTPGMTEVILGEPSAHTLVANCQMDMPFWTRETYNGHYIHEDAGIAQLKQARDYLESQRWFHPRKLAAVAVKTISPNQWTGLHKFIKHPIYERHSYCLAMTLISYNPSTNAFEIYPGGWMTYSPTHDAYPKEPPYAPKHLNYTEKYYDFVSVRATHDNLTTPAMPMPHMLYTRDFRKEYRKHNFLDAITLGFARLSR